MFLVVCILQLDQGEQGLLLPLSWPPQCMVRIWLLYTSYIWKQSCSESKSHMEKSLALRLTSQLNSSMFSGLVACCNIFWWNIKEISKKQHASLGINYLWSFLYLLFSQCYSCLNKHWSLIIQVALLHPMLGALISFPLGHIFCLLLGVPECRTRWVVWEDSCVSLLNSTKIIAVSVFRLCRIVLLLVLSERHRAYSIFHWFKNVHTYSRDKIKWEENQILSNF